ncbi:hypothetical protein HU200_022779 [Digitaria exilis]|uniref:Uncharacterized protein n=1 Tax=Digitaria exilis TaxID=1010633 RepID=A0A835C738_9POAL|nr:hypothetical protein HU200_022779 [Digitaria exilis]CAB3493975.1 unnamed protein product [Digitaria exilis]
MRAVIPDDQDRAEAPSAAATTHATINGQIPSMNMEAAGNGLKSFIAVVLVLSLVLGQLQIQARDIYVRCRFHDANALEFCKLGCAASSLCDNNRPAASHAVNRCDEACYRFCTKHPTN